MSFRGRPFPAKTSCRRCATRMKTTTWVSNKSRIQRRGRTWACVEASHAAVSLSRLRSPDPTCIPRIASRLSTIHTSSDASAFEAPRPVSAPSIALLLHKLCTPLSPCALRPCLRPSTVVKSAMPAHILVQGTLDMSAFASATECSTFSSSAPPPQRWGSLTSVCRNTSSGYATAIPFGAVAPVPPRKDASIQYQGRTTRRFPRPCVVHHRTSSSISPIFTQLSLFFCWRCRRGRACPRSSPAPFPRLYHSILRPDFLNPRLLRCARCLGDYSDHRRGLRNGMGGWINTPTPTRVWNRLLLHREGLLLLAHDHLMDRMKPRICQTSIPSESPASSLYRRGLSRSPAPSFVVAHPLPPMLRRIQGVSFPRC